MESNNSLEQTLQDGKLYRHVNALIVAHLRDNNLNQRPQDTSASIRSCFMTLRSLSMASVATWDWLSTLIPTLDLGHDVRPHLRPDLTLVYDPNPDWDPISDLYFDPTQDSTPRPRPHSVQKYDRIIALCADAMRAPSNLRIAGASSSVA
ncbi:hypothetical protein FXO38_19757 [Capsicum annuum]|nr:hypothetical protein FXO38_19757 [Capsicum annuum]KAF3680018.1 hypothetical protein FXO37_03538 [Capsicum annuum]